MSEKNQVDLFEVTDPNVVVIHTEPSPLKYIYKDLRICNSDSEEIPQTLMEKIVIHPLFTNASGVLLVMLLLEYMFSQIK